MKEREPRPMRYCKFMGVDMYQDAVIATFTIDGQDIPMTAYMADHLDEYPAIKERVEDIMEIAGMR